MLYITLFYYDYFSDTSDTSNINSNLYLFYFDLHFPIFKSIPQFPLLHLLHCYPLSPYFLITTPCLTFLLVLWLSLTNLPLPYCTVLQTTPLHLSALHYINHSYFVVIPQFVNCSQLPTIQVCILLWSTLINSLTSNSYYILTSDNLSPSSEIKDTIQVWGHNT